MKRLWIGLSMIVLVVLMTCSTLPATAATATIVVENQPRRDLLVLNVGESYTFDIRITSDEPFVLAAALGDQYYPGRGIFFNGNDTAHQATEATLHLTVTGKEATADLAAVNDWPTTEDWPAGVAPSSIVVGVRYQGGQVVSYRYNFAVRVP